MREWNQFREMEKGNGVRDLREKKRVCLLKKLSLLLYNNPHSLFLSLSL